MCRSEFGKQQGDFALVLEKIEVITVSRVSNAMTAFGRLEGMSWAKLRDLLCCNGLGHEDLTSHGINDLKGS